MTAKTYDRQTAKFLAVVGESMPELSGEVMQGWIQNPRAVQKALKEALCPPEVVLDLMVWKTIQLGTGLKIAKDFRKAIKNSGFHISDWAGDILGKSGFTVVTQATEVDLVKVTVAELGFKEGARRDQIYKKAQELGLDLCPPEVGPQLRLQYQDQPDGEWVLIGMEPITDSDGYPVVFDVERGGPELWLYGSWGRPDGFWDPDFRWVFVRPRE